MALRPQWQMVLSSTRLSAQASSWALPGKQLAAEVGAQPVTQHRDVELVDHGAELLHLRRRQELRFIDQHAGQSGALRVLGANLRAQVELRMEMQRLALDADARMDPAAVA